jgi:predicted aspartyl protease
MEKTMGKVIVPARIENVGDVWAVSEGLRQPEQVRFVEVQDALVDTAASTLCLPKRFVAQLGLQPGQQRRVRTSGGPATLQMFGAVRLTVQERQWTGDVVEVPDDCPVLIGQIPLEGLDFVVDPVGQRLIGNPAHGGEHILELY